MEGLDAPPFPGAAGQELFENISRQAWGEWQKHQTMLINEKRMNTADPQARKYLREQMMKFLSGEDYERPAGYVSPQT